MPKAKPIVLTLGEDCKIVSASTGHIRFSEESEPPVIDIYMRKNGRAIVKAVRPHVGKRVGIKLILTPLPKAA